MMRSLGIAATGMQAMQTNVEVISNNIANVNTTGFKRGLASFQDLLYQSTAHAGSSSSETGTQLPTGTQIGLGVRSSGVTRVLTQGSLSRPTIRWMSRSMAAAISACNCRTGRPRIRATEVSVPRRRVRSFRPRAIPCSRRSPSRRR